MADINKFPTNYGVIYFGGIPGKNTLIQLRDLGVDIIWNLASELEFYADDEKKYIPEVITANIEDYTAPSNAPKFIAQLAKIATAIKSGKKVFVHCLAGRGRTSTILACLKIILDKISADKALKATNHYCNGPERKEQIKFVHFIENYFNT